MGFFSFTDCASKGRIRIGDRCCLLVPNEFVYLIGRDGKIVESSYYGYGDFGGWDVHDFLALINRRYLSVKQYERYCPNKSEYCKERFSEFLAGVSDDKMTEKYGRDWLREIGIELFFYFPRLHYPLKVTRTISDDVTYESIRRKSKDDPLQGCD